MKTGGRKSRGFESHPLRHARKAALALVVFVAGCAALGGRTFAFSYPAGESFPEVPVVVTDQTGLVIDAGLLPTMEHDFLDDFMRTFQDEPNLLAVQWRGSGCDGSIAIVVHEPGVTISISSTRTSGACDPVPAHRALRIELSRPVDSSRTSFEIAR